MSFIQNWSHYHAVGGPKIISEREINMQRGIKISEICKEEQIYMKESTVKKVINRIKGDRWGKWDDLITEMDGHSTSGIL